MMLVPKRDFDIFNDSFKDLFFNINESSIMKTDIKEHKNKFELMIELPGYDKEDIKIHIEDGYLIVNAKKISNNDEKDLNSKFIRKERYYGEASRNFYIGDNIKEEDIKANFKNGILNLEIPKVDKKVENEEKKYIEIKEY